MSFLPSSRGLLALGALTLNLAAATPAAPTLRLPDTATPLRCAVDLTVDPAQEAFQGRVQMQVKVKKATDILWLHATGLQVTEATFTPAGQKPLKAEVRTSGDNFLGLAFETPLAPGQGTLTLVYTGQASRRDTQGLFQQKDGDHWYAYTQFESTSARRAFPCFDEPQFKVPWQVTLRVPKGQMAVSNTPMKTERVEGDHSVVTFRETKPLPSYLVAFGVGPFDVVDAGRAGRHHTPLRIVMPKGHTGEAALSAKTMGPLLDRLEAYFGIPYPYEKLDSLAIPETAAFGAMENPGLITYNRNLLLVKPEKVTLGFERSMTSVAAHEMAHQWFGDLVTMAWWNDLWLNEGFATWMSDKIVGGYKPEWHWTVESTLPSRQYAMGSDALATARSIRQPIESENDIQNAFDGITYQKGASILGMFEAAMGEAAFQKGVRAYLKAHAYGNATTSDFLQSLAKQGGAWVSPSCSTFLDVTGVPEVSVGLTPDATGKGSTLTLSQRRFLPLGSKAGANQTWQIPLDIRYQAGGRIRHLQVTLAKPTATLHLPVPMDQVDYLLANAGMKGYFRTTYSPDLLQRLLKHDQRDLAITEQVGLMDDLAVEAREGRVPLELALNLLARGSKTEDPNLLGSLAGMAGLVAGPVVPDELVPQARIFLRDAFAPRARAMGLTHAQGDSDTTKQMRMTLAGLAGKGAEDPQLLDQAKTLAERWFQDRKAVAPDMVGMVLSMAALHGDAAWFDRCEAELKKTKDPREIRQLLGALGSFQDPALVTRAQALIFSPDFVPMQAIFGILFGQTQSRKTREAAYAYMKTNFDALVAKLPKEVGSNLIYLGASFSDAEHRADLEAFFRPRLAQLPGAPRVLDQVLESMSLNIANREAQQAQVVAFLKAYQPKAS